MTHTNPHHAIGLILSNVTNDFSGYLMEQMEEQFRRNGYNLLVTTTNHSIESEREMLRLFATITDGILIISDSTSYSEIEEAVPAEIPVIFLNRKPYGCPHTCILENNYSAVYQAILSNVAAGNDRIALVCSDPAFSTMRELVTAYRSAMEATPIGYHENWVFYTDTAMKSDPAKVLRMVLDRGCNTVLTCTQTLTRNFWEYLLIHKSVQELPITLIGFANKNAQNQATLAFDCIAQPLHELIELSVQQMIYRINSPDTLAHEYLLQGSFRPHEFSFLEVGPHPEQEQK